MKTESEAGESSHMAQYEVI